MSKETIYDYSFLEAESLNILIPEEYFFPDFMVTIEFLEKQSFYGNVRNVILDFRNCKYLHGIGMGLEIQQFFIESKSKCKHIYWLGNFNLYKITQRLSEFEYKPEEIIPYFSSINDI